MNSKTNLLRVLLVFAMVTLASCEGIFVEDPIEPRLPRYTSIGNNVAGAFIDHKVWRSIVYQGFSAYSNSPIVENYPIVDSLNLLFLGNSLSNEDVNLEFHFKNLRIYDFLDLKNLNNRKIILDGHNCFAIIKSYDETNGIVIADSGIGQIYFKNVHAVDSLMYSDIIISGTFAFIAKKGDNSTQEVLSGRFDYKINATQNFWNDTNQ
jgi:hypothetical protein